MVLELYIVVYKLTAVSHSTEARVKGFLSLILIT